MNPPSEHTITDVGVVVLNYRTPAMTERCLESLAADADARALCRVVVVDNASGDGSADRLEAAIARRGWQGWARVVRAPENGGFSAGNNLGIAAVRARAYLLLNSDALVRAGAVGTLWRAMQRHPNAGIVSPRLEWPDGAPQVSCFRNPTPWTELVVAAATGPITRMLRAHDPSLGVPDGPSPVDWTSFACVLVRGEVVHRVGPMDEGYFMYFDDVDYCRRVRAAGWTVLHWPEARVVHLRGGSSAVKRLREARHRKPAYFYASRSRYYARYYSVAGLWAANVLWLVGRTIALGRERIGGRPPHTCRAEPIDIWTNWRRPLAAPHQGDMP